MIEQTLGYELPRDPALKKDFDGRMAEIRKQMIQVIAWQQTITEGLQETGKEFGIPASELRAIASMSAKATFVKTRDQNDKRMELYNEVFGDPEAEAHSGHANTDDIKSRLEQLDMEEKRLDAEG